MLIVTTELIDEGTSLPLAGQSHYVNQEHFLQDTNHSTMVGAHLETDFIRDDIGFGGTSSEILVIGLVL